MEGQGDASEQKGLIAEKDDDSEEDLVGGGAMDVDPKAVGTGKSSKKRKVLNKAQVIPVSKLQQQPIKSKGSEEVGRIETFEGRLNELLDVVRGISKLRDSAKGYLKLLLLTAASRGGYAMAAHSSVHDNKAAHPFAECGTSLSVLPESLLEHMNTTQDMSDYLWQIFKFQQPEGAASVLIVNHTGHVLHAFFNGRFIGSMHGAFKAPRFLLETNFTLINGTNSIALLSVMVGLPNSRSVEIWNGKQALYFNNYSWGYQVGLHGEKSNVYSDDGAAKVQWKLYTNSKSQPLTWYKASFNTPEGRDPVALNLGTMGKGEAWVNGQSIGRYRVSFHTSKGSPSQTWYHIPMFKIARYCIAMALIANSDGIIALTTIAISTLYCERYDRFVAMVHGAMEEKDRNPLGITVDTVSVTKVCAHVSTSHPPPVTFWRRKYYSGTKHGHMKHWYDRRPKVHLQQRSLGRKISKLLSCLSVILEEDGSGEGILDTTSRIFIDGADAQMPQNKVLALDNCHSQSSVSTHASASGESSKRTGKNSKPPSKQQQQKPKEERIETDEEDDKESDEEHDEGEDDGRDDDPQNPIPQIRSSEPIQNWMDLENATVPADSGVKTEDVYGLIEGKLRSEGFTGPLKIDGIAGYTDFKAKNIAQENRLVVHHAKPFPRPPDTRGDQAADDHMDYKIDEWLDLRLPPQVTVIIAGDKGYKERMQKLRDAGHTTILIYTRNKVVGGNLDLQNQENARAIFGNPDHAWPWVSIFPGEESQVTARERRTKRFVDHMKSKKEDPEKRKMQRGKRLGGRNKEGHYKRERKKKARKAVEREKENPEKAEETQEMKAERKMNKLRNKSEKSKKYAEGARSVADGAEAVADAVNKAAAEEGTRSAKKVARIAEKVAADLRAAADRATENAEAAEEAWKEGKAKRKREEGGESSGEGPGTYKKRRLMN